MACASDAVSPCPNRYEAAGVTWKAALNHGGAARAKIGG